MGSTAEGPAHAARPVRGGMRWFGVFVGLGAILVAVMVAVPTLRSSPAAPTITTARSLTVTVPRAVIPFTGPELLALLDEPPDLGTLAAPARLASCLTGLGYPTSTAVLGARPAEITGRAAVVLLLAGEDAGVVVALAVAAHCSGADTGLLAETSLPRP